MRHLDRRAALGLIGGAAALPAMAPPAVAQTPGGRWVYMVGNSFLAEFDVPRLLHRLLIQSRSGHDVWAQIQNGAWLADHIAEGQIFRDIAEFQPDWIVLQDHSLSGQTAEGRARSRNAVAEILTRTGACPIYLTPWPRRAGHKLYSEPGMPGDPAEMIARTEAHFADIAAEFGGFVAPVASSWQVMIDSGFDLYARDGYHANQAGAWFVAMLICASLGFDPRWGAPPEHAGLSSLARISVLSPALCEKPGV